MNILTVKKALEISGLSSFDMKHLKEVSKEIVIDGEVCFDEVFNKTYFDNIIPFLEYRKNSLKKGYKKNPNIKFNVLLEISERVSNFDSFGKLVTEHITENPVEKQIDIQVLKDEYVRLTDLLVRINEKIEKTDSLIKEYYKIQ